VQFPLRYPRPGVGHSGKVTAPSCPTNTRLYADGNVVAEGFGAEKVAAMLADHPGAVLWLDLFDPDVGDLEAVAAQFDLHPLAIEDAVQDHERPKLDRYRSHLFLNVYAVELTADGHAPRFRKTEISAFVTERALITARKSKSDTSRLTERWEQNTELGVGTGVGFLVYGFLDVIVDDHNAVAQMIDQAMDHTEDVILDEGGAPRAVRRQGYSLRKALAALRRAVAPMPDIIEQLIRPDFDVVADKMQPYYRDIDDHAKHASDTIDHAWDRISGLLEVDLNEQSNELNDVTRKLAAWAAIIAVPTALTGYFGQNLPYPGYEKWWGFLMSTALIVLLAVGLYVYLKHRKWL
jgi:magnesium transporter